MAAVSLNPNADIFILHEIKEINSYPAVVKWISLRKSTPFSTTLKRNTAFHIDTFDENDASVVKTDQNKSKLLEIENVLNLIPPIGKCLDEEYIKYFKTLMAYEREGMYILI
jgi:hypothetical protein